VLRERDLVRERLLRLPPSVVECGAEELSEGLVDHCAHGLWLGVSAVAKTTRGAPIDPGIWDFF